MVRPVRTTLSARSARAAALTVVVASSVWGCGKPNPANIKLRKQNQGLEGQIAQLKRQQDADKATIAGLTERIGTVPTLAPARLDRLFTVHSIRLGRLSGGANLDGSKPGDEGFKVYIELLDQHNDEFKAAGSFVVEAFDLAAGGLKLGRWEFPVEQAQGNWYSFFTRYEYVLTCPWQGTPPRNPEVTAKVTYVDELTARQFTQQQVIKVNPPPQSASPPPQAPAPAAGASATQPAADLR